MGDASDGESGRPNPAVQVLGWLLGTDRERNVGGLEQVVRYLLGAAMTALGVYLLAVPLFEFAANLVLALAVLGGGLYLIYVARVQYCPLNATIGRDSFRSG